MKKTAIIAAMLGIATLALAQDNTTPEAKLKKPASEAIDQGQSQQLPEILVIATKNPQVETKLGSATTKIDADEIDRTQTVDLVQSLNTAPSTYATDTGARGGSTSVTIRGNRDVDTLVLVDGVRVNTSILPNAAPFLSNAGTGNLDSIEIIRGPQSVLYGSDGIGGVISLTTLKGQGTPSVDTFGEIGSFDTFREGISSQGAEGKFAYSASYERIDTSNDRPNNDYSANRYSTRLDYQAYDNLSLQLNYVGLDGHYGEPGSDRPQDFDSNNPFAHTMDQSNLLSAIVTLKTTDIWTQKLTFGTYFEHYDFNDLVPYIGNFFMPSAYYSSAVNYTVDWQNTVQITSNNRATAGVNFNEFTGHDDSFPAQYLSDWAGYVQDEWEVVKNLNLTAGARYDSYELAGDALTYRLTGAYLFSITNTKVRGSYGTAFQAPTLFQLYSNSSFASGSPSLQPEKSEGWDCGIDQYLFNNQLVLSASYFHNNIRNLIEFVQTSSATGFYQNEDTARNDGVELSAEATLFRHWKSRLSYTYTDASETNMGVTQRISRIPRNHISLDTSYLFFDKLLIGAGVTFVGGLVDTDFSQFPATQVNLRDYWTARIYSRYTINDHFSVFARVENMTNTHYEEALGYPALPIGVYGGVEVRF